MDLLAFGIDAAVVAGIIALSQVVKGLLPEKLVKLIILIPTILGAVAGVALGWGLPWGQVVTKVIIYVGVSTYIYKFGKTVFQSA
jgi:hypothetical protein